MTGATSIAISAAANAQAAAANAADQESAKIACMSFVQGYEHNRASVEDMRQYSECVERIYSAPTSSGEMLIVKGAVGVVLIATIAGALICAVGRNTDGDSVADRLFYGSFFGFLGSLTFCLVLGLVAFLFS